MHRHRPQRSIYPCNARGCNKNIPEKGRTTQLYHLSVPCLFFFVGNNIDVDPQSFDCVIPSKQSDKESLKLHLRYLTFVRYDKNVILFGGNCYIVSFCVGVIAKLLRLRMPAQPQIYSLYQMRASPLISAGASSPIILRIVGATSARIPSLIVAFSWFVT